MDLQSQFSITNRKLREHQKTICALSIKFQVWKEIGNIFYMKQSSKNDSKFDNAKKTVSKLTTTDEDKKELLMKKIIANDTEAVREMSIKNIDLNVFEPVEALSFIDEDVTPLIYCSYYEGRTEIAKLLLKNSMIDIDLQTRCNKNTALIVACMGANYEMVKLLVDQGAEINKPNAMYQTPLVVTIFRIIEESNSFQNKRICFRIAQLLASHGADLNWIIDKQKGYTLLHFMVSSTLKMSKAEKQLNYDIIKFLLEKGADVTLKGLNQKRPEDLVLSHCNMQAVLELLLKYKQKKYAKGKIRDIKQPGLKKKKNGTLFDIELNGQVVKSQHQQVDKIQSRPSLMRMSHSRPQSRAQSRGEEIQSQKKPWSIFSMFRKGK